MNLHQQFRVFYRRRELRRDGLQRLGVIFTKVVFNRILNNEYTNASKATRNGHGQKGLITLFVNAGYEFEKWIAKCRSFTNRS